MCCHDQCIFLYLLSDDIGQVEAASTATECLKSYVLRRQSNGTYAVNFRPEVWVVMQEARHLDQLGVREAPAAVVNVALHKVRVLSMLALTCSIQMRDHFALEATALPWENTHSQWDSYVNGINRNGFASITYCLRALWTSSTLPFQVLFLPTRICCRARSLSFTGKIRPDPGQQTGWSKGSREAFVSTLSVAPL